MPRLSLFALTVLAIIATSCGGSRRLTTEAGMPRLVPVAEGYSSTSVNNAVFRNSSLFTHGDTQYIAFYDPDGFLTLGKRQLGSDEWNLHRSQYKGNVADAHNVISIAVDGNGVLHASFDHHGSPLHYCRGIAPGSLELGELESMTGINEDNVTYPEFYPLAGGNLLGVYRDGASGRGNLVMNRYDSKSGKWIRLHDNLIDGENERNAYWQLCTDANGTIHLSWVWRETWLVETNHDLCYARSTDGGLTWQKSDGTPQQLPITAENAEYAWRIPQNSELINQTSMSTDRNGNPFIVTYWRDSDNPAPQYRLVYHDGASWHADCIGSRTGEFSISGGGTKMIPISRPRLLTDGARAYCFFRDSERGSRVSMAFTPEIGLKPWTVTDLTDFSVDAWEPTLDAALWNSRGIAHLFVQECHQGDGERTVASPPTMVYVLELR